LKALVKILESCNGIPSIENYSNVGSSIRSAAAMQLEIEAEWNITIVLLGWKSKTELWRVTDHEFGHGWFL
jgi:hypothetical protein